MVGVTPCGEIASTLITAHDEAAIGEVDRFRCDPARP
jgi:hypothetical protein